jgi:hypothetical protein
MTLKTLCAIGVLTMSAGCATEGVVAVGEPRHPAPQEVNIPPGHMPPPGKCRIWYPDRPPGHQPPPGECGELRHRVPPGATLLRG